MPKTTLNWKNPTSRPRNFAGAISAMYIGPSTEEPPTPNPPMKRKTTRAYQSQARAQPKPEIRYRTAITRRLSRRPKRSPGKPASIAPKTEPKSAQSGDHRTLHQGCVQLHADSSSSGMWPGKLLRQRKPPTSYHRANFNSLDSILGTGRI